MAFTSSQQIALQKVAESFGQSTPTAQQISAAQSVQSAFSSPTLQKAPVGIYPDYTSTDNVNWTYAPTGKTYYMPNLAPIPASSLAGGQTAISIPSSGGATGTLASTGGTLVGNNAGLAGLLSPLGYTQDTNGLFTYKAPTDTTQNPQGLDAIMASLIPKQESILQSPEIVNQNAIVEQKRQAVQNYTNQLNSIVAKAQADVLSTKGQGRGIPEVIIGGQQAQINREAAIQALPIQAALSASQGDLQMAQDHLSQLVNIKTEEIQNTYKYKMNLYNAIKGYVDKAEAVQLSALEKKATQENAVQINNLNFAQTLATSAFNNGQVNVGASIMKLMANPASPTFMKDVSAYAGQIQSKASAAEDTTTTGGYRFTSTQLNTGAATAALSLANFNSLDGEIKNFYINSKSVVSLFNEALASIKDGSATKEQVKTNIQSMNIPDTVKQYLAQQVDTVLEPAKESFLSGVWSSIKGLIGL